MKFFNKPLNIKETIDVYLSNPDEVLYKGKAIGFSSYNEVGEFSVIAKHTNFRSLIKNKITIYIDANNKKDFKIGNGVLSYSKNFLQAYVS